MERLTYDFCIAGKHCWQVKGTDNLECGEVCKSRDDEGCNGCPIADAFDRLAAIEDILGDDYDLDRLKELVEADRNHPLKEQKTQTNADKIRSMTDEELADFLDKCEGKGYQDSSITPINEDGYHMDMLDWLKQPAKEEKE